jgi:hypothetical protein
MPLYTVHMSAGSNSVKEFGSTEGLLDALGHELLVWTRPTDGIDSGLDWPGSKEGRRGADGGRPSVADEKRLRTATADDGMHDRFELPSGVRVWGVRPLDRMVGNGHEEGQGPCVKEQRRPHDVAVVRIVGSTAARLHLDGDPVLVMECVDVVRHLGPPIVSEQDRSRDLLGSRPARLDLVSQSLEARPQVVEHRITGAARPCGRAGTLSSR